MVGTRVMLNSPAAAISASMRGATSSKSTHRRYASRSGMPTSSASLFGSKPSSEMAEYRRRWTGSNSRASSPGDHPALTNSTIRARNSGGWGGRVLGILYLLSWFGSASLAVSTKPGQVHPLCSR